MKIPFIGFANEDVIYDIDFEPIFISGIEIIVFRYLLMFRINNVEKLIFYYKKENNDFYEQNKALLNIDTELFSDCSALENRVFIHATHKNKITNDDIDRLNEYLKTFNSSIYNIHTSLDSTCPFAISFSFNYNPKKVQEVNYERYLQVK